MADEPVKADEGSSQAAPKLEIKPVTKVEVKLPPAQPAQPAEAVKPAPAMPSMPAAAPAATPKPVEAAKPAAAPSAPEAGAKTEEEKNVFSELFGEDKAQKSAAVMETVVAKEDQKKKSFFGRKPKLDVDKKTGLKKAPKVKRSKPGKLMLQVSVLLLVLVGVAAYTQNSASFALFGVNDAQRTVLAQDQVDDLDAEIIVQKHLSAVLLLDQYISTTDEYFYNLSQSESEFVSENKKTAYSEKVDELEPELVTLLAQIQEQLGDGDESIIAAREVIESLITELEAKEGEVDAQTLLQDIQDLESAKSLLANKDFKTSILAINLDDYSADDLESVFADYGAISQSVTSLISSIKELRVNFSGYFEAIEGLTKNVDPLFNTEFQGNLSLDDVKFNSEGEVEVSGESVTDDTKNFTLISNLIDAYEVSDDFQNVEERSYSKSESVEENFTGNFRISLEIEQ